LLVFAFLRLVVGNEATHVLEGIRIPLKKLLPLSALIDSQNTTTVHENLDQGTKSNETIRYLFNGAGVRSISLLFRGWGDIKIYVASFFSTSATPLNTTESVYEAIQSDHHLLFEFTFLRDVNQKRVTDAWKQQLHHSIVDDYTSYPGYERDRSTFVQCFGPIQRGGTIAIHLLSNGHTVMFDPGYIHKGAIMGYHFQKAFLSMWFGAKPVALGLKNDLLGMQFHGYLSPNTTTTRQQHHNRIEDTEHIVSLNGH
jgi:hypothetical protein